jgi:hypothetical protein
MEEPMTRFKTTRFKIVSAALISAAALITPAIAQEATQEPGVFGFYYPDTRYMTGGYGVRATPRPGYYYRRDYYGPRYGGPAVVVVPGPVIMAPADAYAYYGEPEGAVVGW